MRRARTRGDGAVTTMNRRPTEFLATSRRRALASYRELVVESGLPGAARNPVLFVTFVVRELWRKDISTRAMALSYQLLFCLVPALTLVLAMVAIVPGLAPAKERITTFVVEEFLPTNRELMLDQIERFVANSEVYSLVGLGILLYGTVVLILTLDNAINAIWDIRPSKVRALHRVSSFGLVGILFLGGLGMGVATSGPFQSALQLLERTPLITPGIRTFLTGLVAAWVIFFAMYKLVPSTWVQTGSAAIAAATAAAAFSLAKAGFIAVASMSDTYTQVYGVLGALFVALFWVYIAWAVVLAGAAMAFVLQNYEYLAGLEQRKLLGERYQTYYATMLLLAVQRAHEEGRTPVPLADVAREIELAAYLADRLADVLAARGLVNQHGSSHWEHLSPVPDAGTISLDRIHAAVSRDALEIPGDHGALPRRGRRVASLLLQARDDVDARLRSATLGDLVGGADGGNASAPVVGSR